MDSVTEADMEAIMKRLRRWAKIAHESRGVLTFHSHEADAILARLEHAERVEKALSELVRRASDPDIKSTSFGAWHMLYAAAEEGRAALGIPDGC